jgi:hypothetical protein
MLTAAELVRKRTGKQEQQPEKAEEADNEDLDERIRQLEAELNSDNDESTDDGDSDSDAEEEEEPGVLCLSTAKDERIKGLSQDLLPTNKKRSLKGIDSRPSQKPKSGLETAVKELLDGYVARSAERLPFYCRVCAHQYTNEPEFREHKQGDFHQTAAEMERKASYCKLCRKQLTSPAQMKEHLFSRPHKERLASVRRGQNTTNNNRPGAPATNARGAKRPYR